MLVELRQLPAPAKLNRFLHVTGRRADGYHLLETLFQLIDLADRIDLQRLPEGRIERYQPLAGVPPEQDLTVRAARRLAQASGSPHGVRISLRKRIPMGAGLGGGSSDAATVLLGLNRLWGLHWPEDRLADLALGLGADVPVFIRGRNAHATGIGEILSPAQVAASLFLLVSPAVAVPTAAVFGAPELTRDTAALKIDGLSCSWTGQEGRNDLEPVVLGRYPKVANAMTALRQAASTAGLDPRSARMTGSGSCLFLPIPDHSVGLAVIRAMPRGRAAAGPRLMLVPSLAQHPLHDWAFQQ